MEFGGLDVIRHAAERLSDAGSCADACVALAALGCDGDAGVRDQVLYFAYRMFRAHRTDARFCMALLEFCGSARPGNDCGENSCAYMVQSNDVVQAVLVE
jgi:hypothetical protein